MRDDTLKTKLIMSPNIASRMRKMLLKLGDIIVHTGIKDGEDESAKIESELKCNDARTNLIIKWHQR